MSGDDWSTFHTSVVSGLEEKVASYLQRAEELAASAAQTELVNNRTGERSVIIVGRKTIPTFLPD